MSIKTTVKITRQEAIARIIKIWALAQFGDGKAIEDVSFEPNYSVEKFIGSEVAFDVGSISSWDDKTIENIMDSAFFRSSMFNNYRII